MSVLALDTHALVKELKSAGFSEPQAEAVRSAVWHPRDIDLETVATKHDVALLKADLGVTEANLRREISDLRGELPKWALGIAGLQTILVIGSVAGMLKVLVH